MRSVKPRNKSGRRGLSLPEVLISLAITALLLTAIAGAFAASASAIEINDRYFRASQAARVSMEQLCSLLRRATAFDVGDGAYGNASSYSASKISIMYLDLVDGTQKSAVYQYDATNKVLQLVVGTNTYPLAHNISGVTFTSDLIPDPGSGSGAKMPVNCSVDITVQINEEQVHIRGSAVPHYAVIYK